MCELFAVNAASPINASPYLAEFYTHSRQHPHGWGLTYRDDAVPASQDNVRLWREPVPAYASSLLPTLLREPIVARHMQAHIRNATCGALSEPNCHPFLQTDIMGRDWTLIHNGILFNEGMLWGYEERTAGQTDSERMSLFLMDIINEAVLRAGGNLGFDQTFSALAGSITQLGNLNKLNLVLDDGSYTYVHTNTSSTTLYCFQPKDDTLLFATTPLGTDDEKALWKPVPRYRLLAYRNGQLVRASVPHGNVFCEALLEARKALTGSLWNPQEAPQALSA